MSRAGTSVGSWLRAAGRLAAAAGLVLLLGPTSAQESGPVARDAAPEWGERLEALRPGRPMEYFELAEEIADAAVEEVDRRLARELFGLAGVLDPARLGPSACLALADLETREHAKRRLRALAMLLSQRTGLAWPGDEGAGAAAGSTAAVMAVVESFSLYRRGLGSRALAALRRPGAMELLRSIGHLLPGGVDRFTEDCRVYRGGHGVPQLTADDHTMLLRIEDALLGGGERRWSGQLLLSGGQPLVEVDPDRLASMLGVDPARPFFRRGRWAAQPGRPAAEGRP
ncbi:MAG: hypothetical protein ACYTJ0_03475 [Planctomycetota bacterium]